MSKIQCEFHEAFFTCAWYNGYEERIRGILEYLKEKQKEQEDREFKQAPFPSGLNNDCDNLERVLWSALTEMFGNCGTSPRYGWIEDIDEAIEFLEANEEYWGSTCDETVVSYKTEV